MARIAVTSPSALRRRISSPNAPPQTTLVFVRKSSMELSISLCKISTNAFTAWKRELSRILEKAVFNCALMIGGEGHIVEIDESLFGKHKFNRDHRVHGTWVFGGIDRTTI